MSKHWSTFLRVWVGNMKYPFNIDNRNVEADVFFVSTFLLHSYLRLSSSVWSATAEGNNLGAAATNSSFRRRPRFSSCKRRKNKKQKVICDVFLRHNRNGRLQDMWEAVLGKTTLKMIAAPPSLLLWECKQFQRASRLTSLIRDWHSTLAQQR